jgi:ssDNA-binding Zn-finger/Zn-ribbon topoisomerase 1
MKEIKKECAVCSKPLRIWHSMGRKIEGCSDIKCESIGKEIK